MEDYDPLLMKLPKKALVRIIKKIKATEHINREELKMAYKRIEYLESLIDEALDTEGTNSIHMILDRAYHKIP